MKWITHQTGAVLGAMALALPFTGVVCAFFGAVTPDVMDQRFSKRAGRKRQKTFNRIHRGTSHWFGWWLALFLATLTLPMPGPGGDAATGFALGSLSHVGMDMLTPRGIPILPFSRKLKLALPVCSTGRIGEYIFLATIVVTGLFYFRDRIQLLVGGVAACF